MSLKMATHSPVPSHHWNLRLVCACERLIHCCNVDLQNIQSPVEVLSDLLIFQASFFVVSHSLDTSTKVCCMIHHNEDLATKAARKRLPYPKKPLARPGCHGEKSPNRVPPRGGTSSGVDPGCRTRSVHHGQHEERWGGTVA